MDRDLQGLVHNAQIVERAAPDMTFDVSGLQVVNQVMRVDFFVR